MKIILFNALYYPHIGGGAEIVFKEQAEGLQKRGYDVVVVTTHGEASTKTEVVDGIRVIRVPYSNLYWAYRVKNKPALDKIRWHLKDTYNLTVKKYVEKILDEEKPNLAICHNLCGLSISVWDALRERKIKIIQEIHDQYMTCINSNAFNHGHYCESPCRLCKTFRILHKAKSKCVNSVIGVSEFVLIRFVNLGYYKNAKHYVLHNARSFPIREITYWNQETPLKIGFIGNVSRVKGVDVLVKAFTKTKIDATLTIAGMASDKPFLEELETYKDRDNRINIVGFMNSQEFYDKVDLVVIPSVWPDTFPTVAFEACANNVPVICSRIGGLPEIIKPGINGMLFTPGSVEELSDIFNGLTPLDLNRWKDNARDSVKEMTNPNGMFDKLENIIKETVS